MPSAGDASAGAAGGAVVDAVDRRTALSDLYRSEYRNLVRLAVLLVDQPEAAEEIVQDAFVRLDGAWDRVQDPAARPAYLRSIVMNGARSGLRRRLVARRLAPLNRGTQSGLGSDVSWKRRVVEPRRVVGGGASTIGGPKASVGA